jgi:O-succinylbenzoic acid--CoA ligase
MSLNIQFVQASETTQQLVHSFLKEWENEQDFIEVKTSGSTGIPKIIQLAKVHCIESAKNTLSFLSLKENDLALLCLSIETIAGKMMIVRSIVGNLKLLVTDPTSNPLIGIEQAIDFAAMVPLQVVKIIADSSIKLNLIDKLIIGGGPVSTQLIENLKKIPYTAFQTFGMTETISHVALRKIGEITETYYTALPSVLFEEKNQQLIVHYPGVLKEDLLTNDLVELISTKTFKWLGRTDFIINSGGVKINPEEVESKLTTVINVPFFIAGILDDHLGTKVILIVESEEKINFNKEQLKKIIGSFAVPKTIYYCKKFERTTSGKINRINVLNLLSSMNYEAIL